jgi:hypothetical protein
MKIKLLKIHTLECVEKGISCYQPNVSWGRREATRIHTYTYTYTHAHVRVDTSYLKPARVLAQTCMNLQHTTMYWTSNRHTDPKKLHLFSLPALLEQNYTEQHKNTQERFLNKHGQIPATRQENCKHNIGTKHSQFLHTNKLYTSSIDTFTADYEIHTRAHTHTIRATVGSQ